MPLTNTASIVVVRADHGPISNIAHPDVESALTDWPTVIDNLRRHTHTRWQMAHRDGAASAVLWDESGLEPFVVESWSRVIHEDGTWFDAEIHYWVNDGGPVPPVTTRGSYADPSLPVIPRR